MKSFESASSSKDDVQNIAEAIDALVLEIRPVLNTLEEELESGSDIPEKLKEIFDLLVLHEDTSGKGYFIKNHNQLEKKLKRIYESINTEASSDAKRTKEQFFNIFEDWLNTRISDSNLKYGGFRRDGKIEQEEFNAMILLRNYKLYKDGPQGELTFDILDSEKKVPIAKIIFGDPDDPRAKALSKENSNPLTTEYLQAAVQQYAEEVGCSTPEAIRRVKETLNCYTAGYAYQTNDRNNIMLAEYTGDWDNEIVERVNFLRKNRDQTLQGVIQYAIDDDEVISGRRTRTEEEQNRVNQTVTIERSDRELWENYLSDQSIDINPRIPNTNRRPDDQGNYYWGNDIKDDNYLIQSKTTIKDNFTLQELKQLHNQIQGMDAGERAVHVAQVFARKRISLEDHMKFSSCNAFFQAVYVFCGLGNELGTSFAPHETTVTLDKEYLNKKRSGYLSFTITKSNGNYGLTEIVQHDAYIGTKLETKYRLGGPLVKKKKYDDISRSKDDLPKPGSVIYLINNDMNVDHSAIFLSSEVRETTDEDGNLVAELWYRMVSQPNQGKGPMIEARRIVGDKADRDEFTTGYYTDRRRRTSAKVDGLYDDKDSHPFSSAYKYGHLIKKVIQPVLPE